MQLDSPVQILTRIRPVNVHGSDRLIHKPRFQAETSISENGTIWDAIATGINMLEMNLNRAQPPSRTGARAKPVERNHVAKQRSHKGKAGFCHMSHEIRTPLMACWDLRR